MSYPLSNDSKRNASWCCGSGSSIVQSSNLITDSAACRAALLRALEHDLPTQSPLDLDYYIKESERQVMWSQENCLEDNSTLRLELFRQQLQLLTVQYRKISPEKAALLEEISHGYESLCLGVDKPDDSSLQRPTSNIITHESREALNTGGRDKGIWKRFKGTGKRKAVCVWWRRFLKDMVPAWLPYDWRKNLLAEIIAAIALSSITIPQALAYSSLAALPPVYGLYAVILPPVIYALLGSSSLVTVGPMAMPCLLVGAHLGSLPISPEDKGSLAIMTSIMVGVLYLGLGTLRFGWIVKFLSRPLMSALLTSIAVVVISSQLKLLLGIDVQSSTLVQSALAKIFTNLNEINPYTVIISCIAFLIIFTMRWFKLTRPYAALATLILSISLGYAIQYDEHGIKIVGYIPRGIPVPFSLFPGESLWRENFVSLIPTAVSASLAGYLESIALSKKIYKEYGGRKAISPNREFVSLGVANSAQMVFGGFPMMGSLCNTSAAILCGGRTQVTAIVRSIVIAIVLLLLTSVFYYLPEAVLAANVVVAVMKMVDFRAPLRLFKMSQFIDFIVWILTFCLVVFTGIQIAVPTAVGITLLVFIFRSSMRTKIKRLGRVPGTITYVPVKKRRALALIPSVVVLDFQAPLWYANSDYFKDRILEEVSLDHVEVVVIDMSAVSFIDSTGIDTLGDLIDVVHSRYEGRRFIVLASCKCKVAKCLEDAHIDQRLRKASESFQKSDMYRPFFTDVHSAVEFAVEATTCSTGCCNLSSTRSLPDEFAV